MAPLALQQHAGGHDGSHKHPALREDLVLGPDIYEPLFNWVFKTEEFANWQRDEFNWQLRCDGSPGSGKSTLSALTRRHLCEKFRGERDAVASVFIVEDVNAKDQDFVPAVLTSVLRQLDPRSQPQVEDLQHFGDANASAEELRVAICAVLDGLDRAFLLVDDFNRCDLDLQAALEQEMRHFQDRGMKIMVSSRVPRLENSFIETYCDCPDCAVGEQEVHIFWECDMCKFIVCYSCKDSGRFCPRCGDLPCLRQPYDHVRLNVGRLTNLIKGFVCWDLEKEHGDLGLGSKFSASAELEGSLPPHSPLGAMLQRPENAFLLKKQVQGLVDLAEDNICMARMRLDNLHRIQSIDDLAAPPGDRLPSNLIHFFNAAIDAIWAQPEELRVLGLLAIAAMSRRPYHRGVDFAQYEDAVREFNRTSTGIQVKCPGVEGVLLAAQGFLIAVPNERQPLRAYHETFYAYVIEAYHEELKWWVEVNLRFDNVEWFRKVLRVKTSLVEKDRMEVGNPQRRTDGVVAIQGAGAFKLKKRTSSRIGALVKRPTGALRPTRSRTMAV